MHTEGPNRIIQLRRIHGTYGTYLVLLFDGGRHVFFSAKVFTGTVCVGGCKAGPGNICVDDSDKLGFMSD